jgi:general stress protein 26
VQVVGLTPPSSPQGGLVLLLHFEGDRIALIQQQAVPAAAPSPTELKVTPELKELVDNAFITRHPILIVAVMENGQPILSYRGSTHVFGDRELALWSRHADGNFIRAIEKNPRVTLFYRDAETRTTLQFQGRARVVTDEPTRSRVYEGCPEPERNSDFARLGHAVVVELDRIDGGFNLAPGGRVLMVRGARPAS